MAQAPMKRCLTRRPDRAAHLGCLACDGGFSGHQGPGLTRCAIGARRVNTVFINKRKLPPASLKWGPGHGTDNSDKRQLAQFAAQSALVGFVPTKVRNPPQEFRRWPEFRRFLLVLVLLFSRHFYAAFFGGRIPRASRSFSSEKSYSSSMLI
jgi:hypothetical protein